MPGPQEIEVFQQRDGMWMVDWRVVGAILRSNANQYAIIHNGRVNTEVQAHWYDPFSWQLPDIITYEVDWRAQRSERESMLARLMSEAALVPGRQGCQWFKDYLRMRINESETYRQTFRNNLARSTQQTMHNIESAVAGYTTSIDVARGIRDTSTDFVLLGATFLSGGTALLAAGGGSVLRGAYSYQDHQNLGLAVVETTTSFIMTTIAVGRAAQAASGVARPLADRVAEEGVALFIGANFDVAKGMIEGRTAQEAMTAAAVNAAGSIVLGQLLDDARVKRLIDRLPLPTGLSIGADQTSRLREGLVGALGDRQITSRLSDLAVDSLSPEVRRQTVIRGAETRAGMCLAGEQACAQLEALDYAVQRIGS